MKLPIFLEDVGRPVAYYPKLAKFLGSVNSAIFFCQFIYWKGKEKTENEFFKTAEEIEEETGLTYKQQKNARKILKQKGYLLERLKGVPAKVHYSFNWEKIANDWQEFLRQENEEGSNKIDPKGQTGSAQRDELDDTKGTNYIHRLQHRIHREYNNNSSIISNSSSLKGEKHSLINKKPIANENAEKEGFVPLRYEMRTSHSGFGHLMSKNNGKRKCSNCWQEFDEKDLEPLDKWEPALRKIMVCGTCKFKKNVIELKKKVLNG